MTDGRLFVKRDDLTSSLYGGNKIRKFEHLFADARRRDADVLITVGGVGSNQALAATLHGKALGFTVELSLAAQPLTGGALRNLRGMLAAGAVIRYAPSGFGSMLGAYAAVRDRRRSGGRPYYIPLGATNPLGTAGYVAAGLELAEQIAQGEMPVPDCVFVAAGTSGTAAGLAVGFRIAGLSTRIVAVSTFGPQWVNRVALQWHARRVATLLARLDRQVPRVHVAWNDVELIHDFVAPGYGIPTPQAEFALAWAAPALRLETTYTGRALAACLAWCRTHGAGRTVLFWNTYNSTAFPIADHWGGVPDALRVLIEFNALA